MKRQGVCDICGVFHRELYIGACPTCIEQSVAKPEELPVVIGITGKAGSGKDTAAAYIIKSMPVYKQAAFADSIKDMLRAGFGLSHDQLYGNTKETTIPRYGCTPRHMMQTLGTEWGRSIGSDVWVKAMYHRIKGRTVISDVRFENEAEFVRKRGLLIHIVGRGGIDGEHASENGVDFKEGDVVVENNGTMAQFFQRLTGALHDVATKRDI